MTPKNRLSTFLGLLLAAIIGLTATPRAAAAEANWTATYWNNRDFAGTPVLIRHEPAIDYDWGTGNPAPGVNGDNFSVQWTRHVYFPTSGTYRFTATMNDKMRVWIDDVQIIDQWFDAPVHTVTADRELSAGDHFITVRYTEGVNIAIAKFSWQLLTPSFNGWRGEYYNNRDLSGAPAVVRDDLNIAFDWGDSAPAPGINRDNFSVRWSRTVNMAAARYRFTVKADDGVRLWINGALVIDQWKDQMPTSYSADVNVSGNTNIRMEYYDRNGGAVAHLGWSPIAEQGGSGPWRAEYFNNTSLSGAPVLVRNENSIDYRWLNGSPAIGVNADNFSVRWTRTMQLENARYRFTAAADDGVRVWVNNQLIIDKWFNQALTTHSGEINVSGGQIPVRVEYFEAGGSAEMHLGWSKIGNTTPPPPPPGPAGKGAKATVISPALNVRQGPSTSYPVLFQVPRHSQVTLAGYRNAAATWLMVELANGGQAWVYAPFVNSSFPIHQLTVYTGSLPGTGGERTASVRTYALNVRTGPGIAYTRLTTLSNAQVVTVIGRNSSGTWLKIITPSGVTGWSNASFLRVPFNIMTLPVAG